MKRIFIPIFLLSYVILFTPKVYSQAGTYYNSISTSSVSFVTDLESRIRSPYTRIAYDNYISTNINNFAAIDNGNGTKSVFCVYTGYEHIYSGSFTFGTMSREHVFAYSWMPINPPSTSSDPYSDQHHLFPTHQNNANGRRSNHPLGIVVNVTYQFLEGKVGTNNLGQIVYEPMNSFKGDVARAMLYMSVRYDGLSGYNWDFNWLNGTRLPSLSEAPQNVNLLLEWCRQDPPDKWEVDRNNYIQSIQQNRNPFTDHPEYTAYINFDSLTKLNPVYASEATNYFGSFSSVPTSNSIGLNWTDASGAQLPEGYLILAYDRDNYFVPIDGSEYVADTILSDGAAIVNIPHTDPDSYTFNNLISTKTYYFTSYSYTGSGASRNYKINGTVPQTNATVSNPLAAEPTNHITNFAAGAVTQSSAELTWTDAIPGTQTPSGYLLIANNSNSFTNPSDGVTYTDDIILSDGSALMNITYEDANNFTFNSLNSNTGYYFRMYSYNGTGTQRNYKTNGSIPQVNSATQPGSQNYSSVLLDNFSKANNNSLGNSLSPFSAVWQETETNSPTSISLSNGYNKSASTTAGRDFAFVDLSSVSGYPSKFNNAGNLLEWAINMRHTRTDPSGFDNNNYGTAFILGKTTSDVTTGEGYAVVLGQSGSTDAIRLAKFTSGINGNSRFTNVISSGDYANQYLSIRVTFDPSNKVWTLYTDNASGNFPQTDPRNATTLMGSSADSSYTNQNLFFTGTLWNHVSGANDSCIYDEIYIPYNSNTTLDLTMITEGLYNTVNNRLNKRDTVTVHLRNSSAPYEIVDSSKAVIDSVDFTGAFQFLNITSGNYYIAVTHRNSIETWSNQPLTITQGNPAMYDFTNSALKAFGNNLIQKGSKFCVYSGDVNQDGTVDISDLSQIDNDAYNFTSGYVSTDINGDYIVDLTDAAATDNNANNFISKITP
ncbi:MAG: endonuclease [Ignavibacteria bacterium]